MRWILIISAAALVGGCDPDGRPGEAREPAPAAEPSPLRSALERSSAQQELIDRLGVDEVESAFPTARGGGPPMQSDEDVYSTSSALNVLSSALCKRISACGGDVEACRGRAAVKYGDELAKCVRGVRVRGLSACAREVRSTACDARSGMSAPTTCLAPSLCVDHDLP